MAHFLSNLAAITICLFSLTSFAADFQPEEIPPQHALNLYKAKGVRNVYYLLTKDEASFNYAGGNHYLLVYENGKLRFPKQTSGVVYFDGGSTDLRFENGERFVVPTDLVSVGYLGVQQAPMMMSVDRAPYLLEKVEINDALLKRLGFSKFIAPKTEPKAVTPREREAYIPFVKPETAQIVLLIPPKELDYKEKDQLQESINEIDPTRIKISDRNNQGAFWGYGNSAVVVVTDPDTAMPLLRAKLEGQGEIQVISDALLSEIAERFQYIAANFDKGDEKQKLADIQSIFKTMGDLERYFLMANDMARYETAVASKGAKPSYVGTPNNTKANRQHPIYLTAIAKIRQTARVGYEALDRIGHPAAQEILTHTAQEFDYAAVDIVKGKASVGGQYYFDLWLKFMLSDLNIADKFAEYGTQLPQDIRLSGSSGVFHNFKVSGELLGIEPKGIVPHFVGKRPKFLLSLLGLRAQKDRLKTSLIQFIIDADKQAVKAVAWSDLAEQERGSPYSAQKNFHAKGLINITDILAYLAWTPHELSAIKGFSVSEYQITVMETFSTLFEIASTSLKTTGTMAALIDATIHILDEVRNTKDVLKRSPSARVEQAARVLENRLRIHLQNSVTSLAYVRAKGAADACEILLSPNAWATARASGL